MGDDLKLLAKAFRRRRKKLGISQAEVARRAECSAWTYGELERGYQMFSVGLALRIAQSLEFKDADLAEVCVRVARLHTPPEVQAIVHLVSNTPESYIRLGVGVLEDVYSLSSPEFERLVRKALSTIPPADLIA